MSRHRLRTMEYIREILKAVEEILRAKETLYLNRMETVLQRQQSIRILFHTTHLTIASTHTITTCCLLHHKVRLTQ